MALLPLQRIGRGDAALETTEHVASSASSSPSSSSSTPRPSRASLHRTTFVATTLMALLLALQLVPEACAWRVLSSPASCVQCKTTPYSSLSRTTPLFSTLPDQQQPPQDDCSSSSSSSSSSEAAAQTSPSPVQVQSFSPFLGRQKRRPGLLFEEELDFCLAIPTLEGVSVGNSNVEIAKVVNTFANQAAKKILIGFDCCFGDLADAVKERLRAEYAAPLEGEEEREETDGGEARMVVEGACGFIDAVAALSPCSDLEVSATRDTLLPAYSEAYTRVIDTLLSNNCEFRSTSASTLSSDVGTTPQNDGDLKILPRDRDICLSLYDTITGAQTKTKILNKISNRVSRTMLYGDEDDVAKLTTELTTGKASFVDEWLGGDAEGGCDESVYYDSLISHLTGGLEAPAPAAMGGGYSNAYQRFITLLVQELGTRSASVDPEMFDSFVRWESTLRKNLTQDMWDPHPKELTGQWTLMDSGPNPGSAATAALAGGSTSGKDKSKLRTANLVFRRDGTLRVPPELGLDGSWSFEPGPTHLDTIRFELRLGTPDNRVLAYTGYVDRGQRIETRFSKRPIKMKGRVVLRVRGEPRSSSKFTMQLCKKNMLLENLVVGSTRGTVQE